MQKYSGSRMFTLCGCLFGVFALTFGQDNWPNCSVPERSIVWDDSLTGSTVTVEWAYGKVSHAWKYYITCLLKALLRSGGDNSAISVFLGALRELTYSSIH